MSEIGVTVGGPDRTSIRLLAGWPNGLFYRPDVPAGDYSEELIQKHFADGSSVFHDGDLYEQYFVQRVRNYAHVESLHHAEIDEARVDRAHDRMPTTCLPHAGSIVDVAYAAGRVQWFKTLTASEYYHGVFNKDYGFPPFNVFCSCRMAGIVPGTTEVGAGFNHRKRSQDKWLRWDRVHDICQRQLPALMPEWKFKAWSELAMQVSDELIDNPHPRAGLERILGESFASKGQIDQAIFHLEKAISLRPNVGVKRLLANLKTDCGPLTRRVFVDGGRGCRV